VIKLKIVISASQQNGIEENLTRPIAERLYAILKADNLIEAELVPYFTGTDEQALWNAIQWENQYATSKDYILAIHADAGYQATGASGLYFTEAGKKFITPITQAIMDITPWSDVGIKYRKNLGELKRTNAVAGLIELSFYDNLEELEWMKSHTGLIALTLASGIYKSLNIVKKSISYNEALKTVCEKFKLEYDYWKDKSSIDPYFDDLITKIAKGV
jgi:N-acetylmuramoyl-L-alanine amidase